MADPNREQPYRVVLSSIALETYLALEPDSEFEAVDRALELLASYPMLGVTYNPIYEAAIPPFPLRVFYTGFHGIYYDVDEGLHQVGIHFIEDQRMDPLNRFS